MTWSITILASLGVPCACSPTIRYVLCPFCTVELDPTCSMKTNQGFSAWDELGSSFENHQPVTGIAWNGAFCNVFFISAAGFPALHDISCAMFGSSQEILWDLLDEDLKPLHIWLLWFTTTTACLAPWPLSMGILGCRIHDCGRRRLARHQDLLVIVYFPQMDAYVGVHTYNGIHWHIMNYKTNNMTFGFVSNWRIPP